MAKKGINNMKKKSSIYSIFKRIIDIIVGLIGLLILIPISIIVKISYLISGDFGSIFFTQNRIGKDGKEFKFYKFRSMVPNADEKLFKLLSEDENAAEEYRINKKLKNDPRITKVGRVLRRTSLDELPQFLNVLNGTMSLIGNRPYLPREKKDMGKAFDNIVKTKPGITGYWQVSGKQDVSFKRRLELESYYSDHFNFILDLKIFFATFKAVLFGHGAGE